VSEANHNILVKILTFSAVVEVATGLALIVDPAIVIALLAGVSGSGEDMSLGRFLGIALIALGLMCWPGQRRAWSGSPIFRGMLSYNVLVALYLTYLGTVGHWRGWLLWPTVALHTVVALLMISTWRTGRRVT
jgi:hypothetical protein